MVGLLDRADRERQVEEGRGTTPMVGSEVGGTAMEAPDQGPARDGRARRHRGAGACGRPSSTSAAMGGQHPRHTRRARRDRRRLRRVPRGRRPRGLLLPSRGAGPRMGLSARLSPRREPVAVVVPGRLHRPRRPGDLDGSGFAHNAALVQTGTCFTLLHRGSASRPSSFEPGEGEAPLHRWWWPLGGELEGTRLRVFWAEMVRDEGQPPGTVSRGTRGGPGWPPTTPRPWPGWPSCPRPANRPPWIDRPDPSRCTATRCVRRDPHLPLRQHLSAEPHP